jgi:hypothetical protein
MVADFDARHTIPNSLDDPGTLMAKHGGQRGGIQLITHDGISVADARSDHTHLDLGRAGRIENEFLNHKWLALGESDSSGYLHWIYPFGPRRNVALTMISLLFFQIGHNVRYLEKSCAPSGRNSPASET